MLHLKLKTTLGFFESPDRSNMLVALGSTFLPLFSVNPVKDFLLTVLGAEKPSLPDTGDVITGMAAMAIFSK